MKKGFTLIELVVVLMILALLTHLAVREFAKVQQSKLHQFADKQLEAVRTAVWQPQISDEPVGFLVDMGRLPIAREETNKWGRTVLTLSELWKRPPDIREFALRAATESNFVAGVSAELVDSSILIPCGWRGPYLHLPFGRDRLLDPWGNPMETPDDAGFSRLATTNGAAAVVGRAIGGVRHFGSDARPNSAVTPADEFARDGEISLIPGGMSNQLFVTVSFPDSVEGADLSLSWYMPCGGAITGAVVKTTGVGSSATFICEGLPPGVCTLVVKETSRRAVERVVVPPGGRAVQMKIH